jgi:hypothetical protein
MRIVPAREAEIRREIRDARALDPLIGLAALEQRLEKRFKRGLSYKYVNLSTSLALPVIRGLTADGAK